MARTRFVYVVYIAAPARTVWKALFDPKLTAQYWQHENRSDWKKGSAWEHVRSGGRGVVDLVGTVVECVPPRRLVVTWAFPADAKRPAKHSRVTYEVERFRGITRLTVTHDRLEPRSGMLEGITEGWPKVLTSLKSLLETGKALPRLW